MFSSSRLGKSSSHSRKISNYTEQKFNLSTSLGFNAHQRLNKLSETQKVEFRKILKQRNNHSRMGSDDELQKRSVFSNRSTRYFERSTVQREDKEKDFKNKEQNKVQNATNFPQEDELLRQKSNKNLNTKKSQQKTQNQKSRLDEKLPIINRKLIRQKSPIPNNLEDVIKQFLSVQSNIMRLIQEKWDLIEEKLVKENESSRIERSRSRLGSNHKHSASFQILNQSKEMKPKFTFLGAVSQKKIDVEIMDQIKKLRSLNLSPSKSTKNQSPDQYKILEEMQKRRAQIIQKALAQSMVESQLLKKYYSGQNARGLSTSNQKVGQDNMKNKDLSTIIKRIQNKERNTIDYCQERSPHRRQSVTTQTENKCKFVPPNQEDYESYRYKHPQFHPNFQPLPRSSYKTQFFNYSNVQIYHPKYNQERNIVFPATSTLKMSSYRKEYRQFSPQRINYKELDAYKDKFKQIDIHYMPKKRSGSEVGNFRKGSKPLKFMNQIDYVKRLKTENIVGKTLEKKQIPKILPLKFFASEAKNQYQNPENSTQQLDKSQIKHKNLHTLKYDMKKKFHV